MGRFWILGLLFAGSLAGAEPAVIGHVEGSAAASVQGDDEWTEVRPRRQLVPGDRVWTDRQSRLELQAGRHLLRLDAHSQLGVDELAAGATRLSLRRGSAIARVAMLGPMENFEIGTPNVAVRAAAAGRVRVDVDATRGVTQVSVIEGRVRVYGEKGQARALQAGDRMTFAGRSLARAGDVRPPQADAFEQWALTREQASVGAAAAPSPAPSAAPQAQAQAQAAKRPPPAPRVAQSPPKARPKAPAQARAPAAAPVPTRPAEGSAWVQQQRREVEAAQRDYENWLRYQHGLPPAYPSREQGIPARRVG
jgi:hypothetical protein